MHGAPLNLETLLDLADSFLFLFFFCYGCGLVPCGVETYASVLFVGYVSRDIHLQIMRAAQAVS